MSLSGRILAAEEARSSERMEHERKEGRKEEREEGRAGEGIRRN